MMVELTRLFSKSTHDSTMSPISVLKDCFSSCPSRSLLDQEGAFAGTDHTLFPLSSLWQYNTSLFWVDDCSGLTSTLLCLLVLCNLIFLFGSARPCVQSDFANPIWAAPHAAIRSPSRPVKHADLRREYICLPKGCFPNKLWAGGPITSGLPACPQLWCSPSALHLLLLLLPC